MPKRNRVDTSKSVEPSKEGPHRTCAQREGAPSVSPFTQNQSVQSPCSSMTLIRSPARGESRGGLTAGSQRKESCRFHGTAYFYGVNDNLTCSRQDESSARSPTIFRETQKLGPSNDFVTRRTR